MKKLILFVFLLTGFYAEVSAQLDTVNVTMVKPNASTNIVMSQIDKYILKASAEKTDTNSVWTETYFMVGTEKILAYPFGDYFVGEWTPTGTSIFDIKFVAKTSAGGESEVMVTTGVDINPADITVVAFEDVINKFGGGQNRTAYRMASLPNHLGAYDSLHAELEVVCPTGDCDPWDRKAWIDAKGPDGNWVELIRYMTPYGVGCNHTIDLSDYIFMLEGNVEFRIFTDTWAGSWEYTLTLNYFEGTPDYKYGNVVSVYDGNYALGDYANLQPFETFNYPLDENVEKVKLNMLLSGHGWGQNNTNNAAEFYNITNKLYLNGDSINQTPWNDCNPNPDGCTGQAGTWQYNRAGWCPGAITYPFEYDLTGYISDNEINIHYKYQENYVDLCHQNHPNVANVPNCDPTAGENPYFVFGTSLLMYSNTEPIETKSRPFNLSVNNEDNFEFEVYPNPTSNNVTISCESLEQPFILIYDALGKKMKRISTANILNQNNKITVDLSNFANGIYYIELYNGRNISSKKIVVQK